MTGRTDPPPLSWRSPKTEVRASGIHGRGLFAREAIAPGEELTIDYATTDDDDSESICSRGAATCRRVLSGRDWRRPELQTRYAGWFSSYLELKIRRDAGA